MFPRHDACSALIERCERIKSEHTLNRDWTRRAGFINAQVHRGRQSQASCFYCSSFVSCALHPSIHLSTLYPVIHSLCTLSIPTAHHVSTQMSECGPDCADGDVPGQWGLHQDDHPSIGCCCHWHRSVNQDIHRFDAIRSTARPAHHGPHSHQNDPTILNRFACSHPEP